MLFNDLGESVSQFFIELCNDSNGSVDYKNVATLVKDIYNKGVNCLLIQCKQCDKDGARELMDIVNAKSQYKPIKDADLKKYVDDLNTGDYQKAIKKILGQIVYSLRDDVQAFLNGTELDVTKLKDCINECLLKITKTINKVAQTAKLNEVKIDESLVKIGSLERIKNP